MQLMRLEHHLHHLPTRSLSVWSAAIHTNLELIWRRSESIWRWFSCVSYKLHLNLPAIIRKINFAACPGAPTLTQLNLVRFWLLSAYHWHSRFFGCTAAAERPLRMANDHLVMGFSCFRTHMCLQLVFPFAWIFTSGSVQLRSVLWQNSQWLHPPI